MGVLDSLGSAMRKQQESMRTQRYRAEQNAYRNYEKQGREMSHSSDAATAKRGEQLQRKAQEARVQSTAERQAYLKEKRENEILEREMEFQRKLAKEE